VWLLVCDPVDCTPDLRPSERVERFWDTYKELDVSPLSATESVARGSRLEDVDAIPGLRDAVFGP
jgi:phosphomevalonate kinase